MMVIIIIHSASFVVWWWKREIDSPMALPLPVLTAKRAMMI